MAKVAFSTLKLKQNKDVKTFMIGDKEIEVLQFLPSTEKYDLIMITLQESKVDGIYNPFLKEMFFNLNIIFMYTNLNFTDKQKENLPELYDLLDSNNIINQVISLIPSKEYTELCDILTETETALTAYDHSFAGGLRSAFDTLPQTIQIASTMMKEFDIKSYKEVIEFAKAIGQREELDKIN